MEKRRTSYELAAVLALATFAVYLPALRNEFVNWDDGIYVYENPYIRSLSWAFFQWAFSDVSTTGFWHPLVWLSHALDYKLWGLDPFGHHLTNVLLHAVNTFLATFLITKLLEEVPSLPERAVWIAAAMTGMLFGLHPLHVESVAWVSERKDLLCALFYLLSIMVYGNYAAAASKKDHGRGRVAFIADRRYLLSLAFFLLALSSKPMAVTLPAVLLLLDWYPLGRISKLRDVRTALFEKIPFFALSLLLSIVSILGQKRMGALALLDSVPLTDRVFVAFKALIAYLWKMLVPLDLLPVYPYPQTISPTSIEYAGAMVLVCGITIICLRISAKQPFWLALWGYYISTVLPVIGLVPVGSHFMADRYTYLPSLGPFLLAGLAAAWVWMKTDLRKPWMTAGRRIAIFTAGVLIISLSFLTVRQSAIWNNSIGFWNHLIEKEPVRVPIAYVNRGTALKEKGRTDRALEDFSRAIDRAGEVQTMTAPLKQALYLAYNNRGVALEEQGRRDRARLDYDAAILLEPKRPMAYYNRGMLFGKAGQIDQAIEEYSAAITLDAGYGDAYTNRGWLLKAQGRFDRALSDYTAAISLQPFSAPAYYNRGLLFGEAGQLDRALSDYSAAIDLDPRYAAAYTNRGLLYEDLGRLDLALADFNAAIATDPARAEIYNNRGVLYEMMDELDRAVADYGKAIALDPSHHIAYSNRGIAFGKMGRYAEALQDHTSALSLKPDHIRAFIDRGDLYLRTGQQKLAMKDYHAACDLGSEEGCAALRGNRLRQRP